MIERLYFLLYFQKIINPEILFIKVPAGNPEQKTDINEDPSNDTIPISCTGNPERLSRVLRRIYSKLL